MVFSEATRIWFERTFEAPTPAQSLGWPAIAKGGHVLIQAPTGSGKTLAAFLFGIDRLTPTPGEGLRLLYISPLKALNYDVERNLRGPLAGLRSQLQVGVRTGDTPARERQTMLRKPPDILITTPESLFLLLTSQARETLRGVETVIVDEVHAVAGTKRGAHLTLSLERLDRLDDCAGAADRPLRDPAAARGDRPLRLRRSADRAHRRRPGEGARPRGRRARRGHERPVGVAADPPARDRRRQLHHRRGRPLHELDLAVDLSRAPEARRAAPLDDRVRQQPPPCRAARASPQRAGGEGDGPRPPRVAGPRAARRDRGAAEARPDPVPGRDLLARARHRHGGRRPRRAGRIAEIGRTRPAADREGGARARRRLEGPDLPEVPPRPARVRRRRAQDARRRDRGDGHPTQPAGRARPAGRGHLRRRGDRGRRAARARPQRLPVR